MGTDIRLSVNGQDMMYHNFLVTDLDADDLWRRYEAVLWCRVRLQISRNRSIMFVIYEVMFANKGMKFGLFFNDKCPPVL